MNHQRRYDKAANRIIYIGEEATPDFWDGVWHNQFPTASDYRTQEDTTWSAITKEYLSPGDGVILEGGCGMGLHVAALRNAGYQCIGLDYAEATVSRIQSLAPDLDIRVGDVRSLPFPDASFVGYWSLGVIEHFWSGYEAIATEAKRTLAPNGYLFLVYPYMNPVRRGKARLGVIPRWREQAEPTGFYQFALDIDSVQKAFETLGFTLRETRPVLGRSGLAEEFPRLSKLLTVAPQPRRNPIARAWARLRHECRVRLERMSCYSVLLVLQKQPG